MDDLPPLTEAQQSRIWAAFRKLNHRLRITKLIDWTECIRAAYLACRRELPHESAVALVVRYGRALEWLETYPPTGPRVVGYFAGFAPANPPSPYPARQPIPESDQRALVGKIVKDLIQPEPEPAPDTSPLDMLKRLIKQHGIDETVRWLDELLRPDDGVTRSTLLAWRSSEEGGRVSRPLKAEKRARIAEAIRRLTSAD